jgi:hypothetical protein
MAEQISNYRSYDPDNDAYDETTTDQRAPRYRFGQLARTDSQPESSVPLFLSDYDGEPDPGEFITPLRKPRSSISSRILAGVSAAAAVAIVFALVSSDATRDIIVNAKASIATALPAPSVAAQPDPTQLTARDIQLKDPARLSAPANQTPGVRTMTTAAVTPTRAEITNAYQSALQSGALQSRAPAVAGPVAAAPAAAEPVAAPPARKLAADELATLMNRARALLAAGDIPPARLLLERAADAQEPGAALMLARTYDPDVLGTQDARNIIPDPATARVWYQRAAQLGSADAQRRLSQLQN